MTEQPLIQHQATAPPYVYPQVVGQPPVYPYGAPPPPYMAPPPPQQQQQQQQQQPPPPYYAQQPPQPHHYPPQPVPVPVPVPYQQAPLAVVTTVDLSGNQEWQSGVCSCHDPVDCLCAVLLPHCTIARTRRDYDSSNVCMNCLCLTPCIARNIIREGYGIHGDCVGDIVLGSFCWPCAIAQMQEEVKRRGPVQTGQAVLNDQWTSDLCGCCAALCTCCYALHCPNCAAATARTKFDRSNWFLNCLGLSPCLARNIIREGYGIEGTWLDDLAATVCCMPCALTQMLREVEKRGGVTRKNVVTAIISPAKMV